MRFRIPALLVASVFIMLLMSCDMGNNKAENELSEKRRVEISKLESQIKDIDSKISYKIKIKSLVHSGTLKGMVDATISELRSRREILINKLTVLYKIEQEYQSKK